MTRAFLGLNAIIFAAFGVFSFFNPDAFMTGFGANSMNSDGFYELRGIYGGVSLGAAALCLSGFLKADMQKPALYFLLAYTGGYVFARIAALPFDGIPSPILILFAGFELITALISLYLLRRSA